MKRKEIIKYLGFSFFAAVVALSVPQTVNAEEGSQVAQEASQETETRNEAEQVGSKQTNSYDSGQPASSSLGTNEKKETTEEPQAASAASSAQMTAVQQPSTQGSQSQDATSNEDEQNTDSDSTAENSAQADAVGDGGNNVINADDTKSGSDETKSTGDGMGDIAGGDYVDDDTVSSDTKDSPGEAIANSEIKDSNVEDASGSGVQGTQESTDPVVGDSDDPDTADAAVITDKNGSGANEAAAATSASPLSVQAQPQSRMPGTVSSIRKAPAADNEVSTGDAVNVASIGDTKYTSLADAIQAVTNNVSATIKILANITQDTALTIGSGKSITIIGNGSGGVTFTDNGQLLVNGGSLTLGSGLANNADGFSDGLTDNSLVFTNATSKTPIVVSGGGSLTINDGFTLENNSKSTYAVSVGDETVTTNEDGVATPAKSTYNGNGGAIKGGTLVIGRNGDGYIKGGTYNGGPNEALAVQGGHLSEISGGSSGATFERTGSSAFRTISVRDGGTIDTISGTDDAKVSITNPVGHGIMLWHGGHIGTISGNVVINSRGDNGYERGYAAIRLYDDDNKDGEETSSIGTISGGTFAGDNYGLTISGNSNHIAHVDTISGGKFYGTTNGLNANHYSKVGEISGGEFTGVTSTWRSLEDTITQWGGGGAWNFGTIEKITGGTFTGNDGFVNYGTIGSISNATLTGKKTTSSSSAGLVNTTWKQSGGVDSGVVYIGKIGDISDTTISGGSGIYNNAYGYYDRITTIANISNSTITGSYDDGAGVYNYGGTIKDISGSTIKGGMCGVYNLLSWGKGGTIGTIKDSSIDATLYWGYGINNSYGNVNNVTYQAAIDGLDNVTVNGANVTAGNNSSAWYGIYNMGKITNGIRNSTINATYIALYNLPIDGSDKVGVIGDILGTKIVSASTYRYGATLWNNGTVGRIGATTDENGTVTRSDFSGGNYGILNAGSITSIDQTDVDAVKYGLYNNTSTAINFITDSTFDVTDRSAYGINNYSKDAAISKIDGVTVNASGSSSYGLYNNGTITTVQNSSFSAGYLPIRNGNNATMTNILGVKGTGQGTSSTYAVLYNVGTIDKIGAYTDENGNVTRTTLTDGRRGIYNIHNSYSTGSIKTINQTDVTALLYGLYNQTTPAIDSITDSTFTVSDEDGEGIVNYSGSTITKISAVTATATGADSDGMLNNGTVKTIEGSSFTGAYAGIYNSGAGTIDTIDAIKDDEGNVTRRSYLTGAVGLQNSGRTGNTPTIDSINNTTLKGTSNGAVNTGTARLNTIGDNNVFYGQNGYAYWNTTANQTKVEPNLKDSGRDIGTGRYWGGSSTGSIVVGSSSSTSPTAVWANSASDYVDYPAYGSTGADASTYYHLSHSSTDAIDSLILLEDPYDLDENGNALFSQKFRYLKKFLVLSYDKNAETATGTVSSHTETEDGEKIEVAANGYTLEGWKFVCWNTKPDGSGTNYYPYGISGSTEGSSASSSALPTVSNVSSAAGTQSAGVLTQTGANTLMAAGMQGGSYVLTSPGSANTLNLMTNGNDDYTSVILSNGNAVLYAIWEPYKLSYVSNASNAVGTMDDQKPEAYTTAVKALANRFRQAGYYFTGWNTKADGTGTSYNAGDEVEVLTDEVVYAQWTPYQLSYSGNASDVSGSMESSVPDEDSSIVSVSENTFTREGYTFTGWNTKADGTGETVETGNLSSPLTSDMVVYAQWAKEETPEPVAPAETPEPIAPAETPEPIAPAETPETIVPADTPTETKTTAEQTVVSKGETKKEAGSAETEAEETVTTDSVIGAKTGDTKNAGGFLAALTASLGALFVLGRGKKKRDRT